MITKKVSANRRVLRGRTQPILVPGAYSHRLGEVADAYEVKGLTQVGVCTFASVADDKYGGCGDRC